MRPSATAAPIVWSGAWAKAAGLQSRLPMLSHHMILDFDGFRAVLQPGPVFGLDVGSKTIGVAVSDATRLIASPLLTIGRTRLAKNAQQLFSLIDERRAVGLVVGLPRNMAGGESPSSQAARAFARNLLALRDMPILLWDERLSTAAVTRTLLAADASRARRAELVDKLAAAYILQGAIDRLQESGA